MKGNRKNNINVEGSEEMKCKGGRKVEEVVGRWKGKEERKLEKVYILK